MQKGRRLIFSATSVASMRSGANPLRKASDVSLPAGRLSLRRVKLILLRRVEDEQQISASLAEAAFDDKLGNSIFLLS